MDEDRIKKDGVKPLLEILHELVQIYPVFEAVRIQLI
jgi:hypothetical protein